MHFDFWLFFAECRIVLAPWIAFQVAEELTSQNAITMIIN